MSSSTFMFSLFCTNTWEPGSLDSSVWLDLGIDAGGDSTVC